MTPYIETAGDRPANKIEVTPEMIEAWLQTLYNFHITEPEDNEMRDAVAAVF